MATPRWITKAEVTQEEAGDVQGPDSSVDGNIALFDGTTGKLLKAAGVVEGVATIDATTNILIGDGAGNAVDSNVPISSVGLFLSANIARVDPSGDDGTGTIGDLTKPFLMPQAAIDALEIAALDSPVLDIGASVVSGFTTSLSYLAIVGSHLGADQEGMSYEQGAFINGTITNTSDSSGEVTINLVNCAVKHLAFSGGNATIQNVRLQNAAIPEVLTVTAGELDVYSNGTIQNYANLEGYIQRIDSPSIMFLNNLKVGTVNGTAANVEVDAVACVIENIAALGGGSSVTAFLTDSRLTNTPGAGVTVDYNANDLFFNPAKFDFSTLPTTEPTEVGRAWIDTTGGFNIVKVKL